MRTMGQQARRASEVGRSLPVRRRCRSAAAAAAAAAVVVVVAPSTHMPSPQARCLVVLRPHHASPRARHAPQEPHRRAESAHRAAGDDLCALLPQRPGQRRHAQQPHAAVARLAVGVRRRHARARDVPRCAGHLAPGARRLVLRGRRRRRAALQQQDALPQHPEHRRRGPLARRTDGAALRTHRRRAVARRARALRHCQSL